MTRSEAENDGDAVELDKSGIPASSEGKATAREILHILHSADDHNRADESDGAVTFAEPVVISLSEDVTLLNPQHSPQRSPDFAGEGNHLTYSRELEAKKRKENREVTTGDAELQSYPHLSQEDMGARSSTESPAVSLHDFAIDRDHSTGAPLSFDGPQATGPSRSGSADYGMSKFAMGEPSLPRLLRDKGRQATVSDYEISPEASVSSFATSAANSTDSKGRNHNDGENFKSEPLRYQKDRRLSYDDDKRQNRKPVAVRHRAATSHNRSYRRREDRRPDRYPVFEKSNDSPDVAGDKSRTSSSAASTQRSRIRREEYTDDDDSMSDDNDFDSDNGSWSLIAPHKSASDRWYSHEIQPSSSRARSRHSVRRVPEENSSPSNTRRDRSRQIVEPSHKGVPSSHPLGLQMLQQEWPADTRTQLSKTRPQFNPAPSSPPPPPPPRYHNFAPTASYSSSSSSYSSDSDEACLPYLSSRRQQGFGSRNLRGNSQLTRQAHIDHNYLLAKHLPSAKKGWKCHSYNKPLGDYGEPLSTHVRIIRSDGNQTSGRNTVGFWQWPDVEPTYHSSVDKNTKLMDISEAKRWFDDSKNHHTLDLTCLPRSEIRQNRGSGSMRWLHVERQNLDFDEFKAIVLSAPDMSRDWNIVLLSLLQRIQRLQYDPSTDRFSPWIMRADRSNPGLPDSKSNALSAISINMPYFALRPIPDSGTRSTDQKHSAMTLFEWDDRFEGTNEWDSEQSFRIMCEQPEDKNSLVHVPHVWTMAFNDSESSIHGT